MTQNVVVGHSPATRVDGIGGLGIAHRFAGWNGDGKMKVFAEARYLDVLTPAITTQANGLGTTSVDADTQNHPGNLWVSLVGDFLLGLEGRSVEMTERPFYCPARTRDQSNPSAKPNESAGEDTDGRDHDESEQVPDGLLASLLQRAECGEEQHRNWQAQARE